MLEMELDATILEYVDSIWWVIFPVCIVLQGFNVDYISFI